MVADANKKSGLKIKHYDDVIALEEKEALPQKIENELLNLQLETIPTELKENIKKGSTALEVQRWSNKS